ncbi:ImmA/IrrE family metallo-endopeptidase [Weissella diestrammenae]|uniref:ImmA/IrrE family metallo-endopeptidase n=1 Tax=Weissella diestrammenae TaxID=1162633 RepID=A0A7G9T4G5_9LACO|nr:ImmA/IrrE family metallo-endopeptidase [Weissella diestrammenae]MCM0583526.1 ImmA/IrrE family metallo-endopeptidase [Weissella diestrammenae]QNN74990.1 ImmA/IrrE family metallo-endopeptidase [Weissella diestrammenae]
MKIVKVVDNDEYIWGLTVYSTNTIYLKESLNHDRKIETLVHEMTHAILFESGYKDHTEDMARTIGKLLYLILKENGNPNTLELPNWLNI